MEVLGVDVRERAECQVPGIAVVRLEGEMGVLVLVGLLEHGILEGVALPQRAVPVVVVVHPLVHRGRLLADRSEGGVRVQQGQGGGQAVVRHPEHADVAVVRDMPHEPVDGVVGVRRLVRRGRVREVDLRRQLEHAFRLEPAPEILEHEEVAVLRELLETHRHLSDRPVGDAVGGAAEQDRERSRLVGGREDHGLQARAVPHRDHDFLERECGLRRRLLRLGDGDEEHRPS